MKKLGEYINNEYISLKGIDEDAAERLSNLEGYEITECCCDDCKCCGYECEPCIGEAPVVEDPAFKYYFYSEGEIINKLKTVVNVQDLFNLHSQFSANRFSLIPSNDSIPLIFTEKLIIPSGEQLQGRSFYGNLKLMELIRSTELSECVVLVRLDNSVQLFGLKYTGTNGQEGSIKNSLLNVAKTLESLEKLPEVTWSQVLDVAIDNADDVYTFLITCTFDPNSIPDNPSTDNMPQPEKAYKRPQQPKKTLK